MIRPTIKAFISSYMNSQIARLLFYNREKKVLNERPQNFNDLLKRVKDLQIKQKVFGDDYPNPERILNLMDSILWKIIREPLVSILETDPYFGNMLCSAFFRQSEHIRGEQPEIWTKTKQPLYCLLVAAYVSNSMSLIYKEQEEFRTNHEYFETAALSLFNDMYMANDEKLEYHVLAYDYENVYRVRLYLTKDGKLITNHADKKKKKKEWERPSRELLCVAYRGECKRFIFHVACQTYIKTRWKEGKVAKFFELRCKDVTIPVPVPARLGILGFIKEKFNKAYNWTLSVFWTPRSKYVIHLIFHLLYLACFSIALLYKPWIKIFGGSFQNVSHTISFYAFSYVLVSNLTEDMEQIYKIIRIYLAIALALAEILFTGSFILTAITTLKYLSVSDYFGVKLQLIKTMASSISKYMLIFGFFWLIYAICYLSLTERVKEEKWPFWHMFQSGIFEILGESRDEDREGNIPDCDYVYWNSSIWDDPNGVRCLFRSILVPPLLFFYMITATIMLINIFTAMLSHEYEKTSENAAFYSKFHKYEMLARFESKIFFPRPLILLYLVFKIIYWLFTRLQSNFCRSPCCDGIAEKFPLNIISSWFASARKWGTSPKDAKVNNEKVEKLLEKVLERRGTDDFIKDFQRFIDSWAEKRRGAEPLNSEDIRKAEEILQEITGTTTGHLAPKTNQDPKQ